MSVRSTIGRWLANDPRARLELPEQGAGLSVDRFEPAFHVAVEHDSTSGRQGTAPDRKLLLDLPNRLTRENVPGREHAHVATWAWRHANFGADIRCSCDVAGCLGFEVHAHVVPG